MQRIGRKREARKNAWTLLIILALAVIIFSVDAIGSFMAQKVIGPIADRFGKEEDKAASEVIGIEAFSCFVCEKAVSDSPDATGFWVKSDNAYHLLDRVSSNKPDGNFLCVKTDGFSIRASGTGEQIATVREAFLCLAEGARELVSLSDGLTQNDITRSESYQRAQVMLERTQRNEKDVRSLSETNATVKCVKDMLNDGIAALREIPAADAATYTADFYRAACTYCWRYGEFLQRLKAI